jgi:hypothetical protein
MGLIGAAAAGVSALLVACSSRLLADEFKAWVPSVVDRIISFAVSRAPEHLRERLAEEWRGHVNDTPGDLGKLVAAFGFVWASGKLRNEAEHAGVEGDTTPIRRQTELAIWAVERRIGLEQELDMLQSGRMRTGEKRKQGGAWVDVDTTSESIERVRAHIAQLDAVLADR